MSLFRFAWKNILGSPVRSGLLFLCVVLVAGSVVASTLVVQGAKENLRLSLAGMADLGPDLVVVPGVSGANRTGQLSVDLEGLMKELSAVPGVAAASPRQSLVNLTGDPYNVEKDSNLPIILVQIGPGSDAGEVATRILKDVSGVSVFDSAHFFRTGREQMLSLLQSIPGLLTITWVLSIVFIGLVFSVAANERRREIGVIRALGSTRSFVLQSILAEGFLLALGGGMAGAVMAILAMAFLGREVTQAVGLPLVSPSVLDLALLIGESLLVAAFSTILAAFYPAWRISRQDPALAMRG